MATHMNPGTASASGWAVWQMPDEDHRWNWSAYGPGGSRAGYAPSKADAERRAQAEREDLVR
jgi:hypothetical protein